MTAAFDDRVVAAAVARGLDAVRDWPIPANDALCSAEKYALLGQDFRNSAWQHLDAEDLPQASNKAWGLVAQTIKAISLHHGRVIHSHRGLLQVPQELARLVDAAGDAETQRWIRTPSASPGCCTSTSTSPRWAMTMSWPDSSSARSCRSASTPCSGRRAPPASRPVYNAGNIKWMEVCDDGGF